MATGTLTNTKIKDRYKSLLKLTGTANDVLAADASAKYVEDGDGNDSALSLSTTRVGIGTTAPTAQLHVLGVADDDGVACKIHGSGNTIDDNDVILQIMFTQDDQVIGGGSSFGHYIEFRDQDDAVNGAIEGNADATVAYNTSSDYRLKTNIEGIAGALDTLNKTKPVAYNWKKRLNSAKNYGFIAHELQEHVPYAVSGEKDAMMKREGETDKISPQMIDYSKLVPFLTAAIQELSAKVTALENA